MLVRLGATVLMFKKSLHVHTLINVSYGVIVESVQCLLHTVQTHTAHYK